MSKEFRLKMIFVLTRSLVDAELAGDSKAFYVILSILTQEMKELDQRKDAKND